MQRIGILGGTFNPIHIGHLAIAQTALEKCGLDKVVFVPSNRPPHKNIVNLASAQDRFNMVRLAIVDNPVFEISDFEIKRPGRSFTIDTVKHFCKVYSKETRLFFITGEDSVTALKTWKNFDELSEIITFIIVNRPGTVNPSAKFRHLSISMPGIDISSSYIRRFIVQGKSVKYLVPEEVFKYIEEHKLYSIR